MQMTDLYSYQRKLVLGVPVEFDLVLGVLGVLVEFNEAFDAKC